jgi:hypothetical protein
MSNFNIKDRRSSLLMRGGEDCSVTFLGTGSAIPSKYRNVSGILLETGKGKSSGGGAVMLDAGEGSWQQMVRIQVAKDKAKDKAAAGAKGNDKAYECDGDSGFSTADEEVTSSLCSAGNDHYIYTYRHIYLFV